MKSRMSCVLTVFAFALLLIAAGRAQAQSPTVTAFPGRGVTPFGATFQITPGECNVVETVWNVGDAETPDSFDIKDGSLRFEHLFPWPGVFNVTATITDGCGHQYFDSVTVLVAPDITPIPLRLRRITASKTGPSVNFELKFKSAYAPLQVFMDFGDGSSYSGMATSDISHVYSGPGSYSIKVTVLDVFGQSVSASKQIEIE